MITKRVDLGLLLPVVCVAFLGAQCAGPHATDLISEMVVAVREELTAAELGNTVHAHPTFAEAWMEASHALHKNCIHAPPAR